MELGSRIVTDPAKVRKIQERFYGAQKAQMLEERREREALESKMGLDRAKKEFERSQLQEKAPAPEPAFREPKNIKNYVEEEAERKRKRRMANLEEAKLELQERDVYARLGRQAPGQPPMIQQALMRSQSRTPYRELVTST